MGSAKKDKLDYRTTALRDHGGRRRARTADTAPAPRNKKPEAESLGLLREIALKRFTEEAGAAG